MRQDVCARPRNGPELEDAASRRLEEEVVSKKAGVDRLLEEEGVLFHRAVDKYHRDAFLVGGTGAGIGVVHVEARAAPRVALDDESVRRGAR